LSKLFDAAKKALSIGDQNFFDMHVPMATRCYHDPYLLNIFGLWCKRQGQLSMAASLFSKSIALREQFWEARFNLAVALQRLDRSTEAMTVLRDAEFPKAAYLSVLKLSVKCYLDLGNFGEAESAAHEILQTIKCDNKTKRFALMILLVCNCVRSDFKSAQRHLTSLNFNNDEANSFVNRMLGYAGLFSIFDCLDGVYNLFFTKYDVMDVNVGQMYFLARYCSNFNLVKRVENCFPTNIESFTASPFSMLTYTDDAKVQKKIAENFVNTRQQYHRLTTSRKVCRQKSGGKIRIGYFSSDFYNHATMVLLKDVLFSHDTGRFEIYIYDYGIKRDDLTTELSSNFANYILCCDLSDEEIAQDVSNNCLDIVVDLKGFTKGARQNLFDFFPNVCKINFLGFPGTIGKPDHYAIVDPVTVPLCKRDEFSERLAYFPGCYQPNNYRVLEDGKFNLRDASKPFVFCCLNNSYKISEAEIEAWCQILQRCKHSSFILLSDNQNAQESLTKIFTERFFIDRIKFVPRSSYYKYLKKLSEADLFLDTFLVNAHTTAADALRAGTPLLTVFGNKFASRVATSLLHHIGASSLICIDRQDYIERAVHFYENRDELEVLRRSLGKRSNTLFDPVSYVKRIEELYIRVLKHWQNNPI
jgi:protein O-GlcNAc transferase